MSARHLLALSLACFPLVSGLTSDEFHQARTLYYQGADGDSDAYAKSERMFARLNDQPNPDPLARAYFGSLKLWEASHTWALWRKYSLSKDGIELLDRAVSDAPNNLEVRFVRAVTTYRLPSLFHKREQSESDFALLASRVESPGGCSQLEPRLAAASLYYHAEFLKDASQTSRAIQLWNQAIALAPASRAAGEARQELARERAR